MYKVNVAYQGARLSKPFTMIELAYIEDFAVSIYLCQGTLAWHKHLDQDELFLVHSGTISLDTEFGSFTLEPGEMLTVPKGVLHRSSSRIRSEVLLFSPKFLPDRKNGHRLSFPQGINLTKVNLFHKSRSLSRPYQGLKLAQVEDFTLSLLLCEGTSSWYERTYRPILLLVVEGILKVETGPETITLGQADLTIIPPLYGYRLHSPERTLVLSFQKTSPLRP